MDNRALGDLAAIPTAELLSLHARIGDELRRRGVTRSTNTPTGDLAEYLFCAAFGWTQADSSSKHFDAVGPDGRRYQIKGRRLTRQNPSRQLSAIRDLDGRHFDVLAGVLFDEVYGIQRAALVPEHVVREKATYVSRTNSYKFFLRDDVWDAPDVRDVTADVRSVEL